MSLATLPGHDELEVSLFGPGVGESVVVHVGDGEWIVVDSCVDPGSRRPVALDYLEKLNVNVATAVKLIVVTHWHDDHMRGVSELVRSASAAKFVCSAVLRSDEVKTFIAAARSEMKVERGSGVDEFSAVLGILQERRHAGTRKESVGPTWASADQLLLRRTASSHEAEADVYALSPSAATVSRGFHQLAPFLPKRGMPKRAAVSVEPNETSLALSVRFGNAVALLGSDLEVGSATTGWCAVLTTAAAPGAPAHVFKVPHHGSENAYHEEIWRSWLAPNVYALLTPFIRGREGLPKESDLLRMKRHTDNLFCTAPRVRRSPLPDPMVQKTVREVTKQFRPRSGAMGHIRVRVSSATTAGRVERFGVAYAA